MTRAEFIQRAVLAQVTAPTQKAVDVDYALKLAEHIADKVEKIAPWSDDVERIIDAINEIGESIVRSMGRKQIE